MHLQGCSHYLHVSQKFEGRIASDIIYNQQGGSSSQIADHNWNPCVKVKYNIKIKNNFNRDNSSLGLTINPSHKELIKKSDCTGTYLAKNTSYSNKVQSHTSLELY